MFAKILTMCPCRVRAMAVNLPVNVLRAHVNIYAIAEWERNGRGEGGCGEETEAKRATANMPST